MTKNMCQITSNNRYTTKDAIVLAVAIVLADAQVSCIVDMLQFRRNQVLLYGVF